MHFWSKIAPLELRLIKYGKNGFTKLTLLKICEKSFDIKQLNKFLKILFKFCNLFPHLCKFDQVTYSYIVLKILLKIFESTHTEELKSKI